MNRKLQFLKTAILSVFLLGGANLAWGKIVWPDALIQYRTDQAIASAEAWNSGYPKSVLLDRDGFEINGGANIWIIGEFVVPNISKTSEIKLICHYPNNNYKADVSIYAFPYDMPSPGAAFSEGFKSNMTSALDGTAIATFTSSATTATISGEALTTLKTTYSSYIADDALTMRVVMATSSSRAQISSLGNGVPNRRIHMEVGYSDITNPIKIGETGYSDLATAVSTASANDELTLYDDCFISSRLTFSTANKNLTFKAAENRDVVIYKWNDFDSQTFLANQSCTITFDGSASGASLTIDNQNVAKEKVVVQAESSSEFVFKDVTFQNFTTGSAVLTFNGSATGTYTLENVTFKDCNPTTALVVSPLATNDKILLKGSLNFDNCPVTHFSVKGRLRATPDNTVLTLPNPITIDWTGSKTVSQNVVVKVKNNDLSSFKIVTEGCDLYKSNEDMKLTQAYTLAVSDAKAATLVLPFASKIPTDATCYTLKHTDGSSVVSATEVTSGTLDANTPVYVEANEGSYKFVSTATSGEFATGSDPVTKDDGALTGVYSDLTFTTENIASTYANTYILNKINEKVGFYKAANGRKVGANRCYLKATNVPGAVAARGLEISFDDEVTGLNEVRGQKEEVRSDYFNLAGQRVAQPTKGLYIVNGKKVVIK